MARATEADLGRTVLYLDDLLTNPAAAPALDLLISRADANTPGSVRDQIDAALREVNRNGQLLNDAGMFEEYRPLGPAAHPAWVRLGILDALLAWVANKGSTCMHAPSAKRPEPVYAVAWRPRLVFCGACTHLARLPKHSTKELTCDGCGKLTTGAHTDDPLCTFQVQAGVLSYGFGACAECRYWPDEVE
jgi:hypothetical protein